jgi:hypothetical protein
MLRERALRIGKPTPLVGVATEPASFDPALPVVLVLNSGVMHHVGACRLSVKIARAVAARGLLAVRFDYSGIGDSEPRRGSDAFDEVSIRECAEVMDYIEKSRGANRFILYGLCSGADAAYNTALADERVVAIAQIDAYCYVTPRYYFEHYWPALLQGERWRSFLRRQRLKLTGRGGKPDSVAVSGVDEQYFEVPTYTRIFPPREQVAAGLKKLVGRGVHMYVNFTGGEPLYNYRGQYRDSFRGIGFGDLLNVDYYRETNHIITQPRHQAEVVANIAGWMDGVARKSQREGLGRVA